MRALKFITCHVIYNPAYAYKIQLKTTLVLLFIDEQYIVRGSFTLWCRIGRLP